MNLTKKQKKEYKISVCEYCFSAGCVENLTPCDNSHPNHIIKMNIDMLEKLNIEEPKFWENGIKKWETNLKNSNCGSRKIEFEEFTNSMQIVNKFIEQNYDIKGRIVTEIDLFLNQCTENQNWQEAAEHIFDIIFNSSGKNLYLVKFKHTFNDIVYIWRNNKKEAEKDVKERYLNTKIKKITLIKNTNQIEDEEED